MKKIVACFKWVKDDADIRVKGDRSLDFARAKEKISEYDRNAIQAAVDLKAAAGGQVIGLTIGTKLKPALKDALSRGLDEVVYIDDKTLSMAGAGATAKVLAGAIKAIGDVDAVVCGEGSSDTYNQQVGPRLAALLGMTSVSCVSVIQADGDALTLTRKLDDCQETVEISGPAVITVMPDVNEAPIPSLKQILAAKKKPSQEMNLADVAAETASQMELKSMLSPVVDRKKIHFNAGGESMEEAAKALVDKLTADGLFD